MHARGYREAIEEYEPSIRRDGQVRVPEVLLGGADDRQRYECVILGAGCAGLSLCYYLLAAGFRGRILLLDRKSTFTDDRTWCFWDVEPTPFSHLLAKRWNSWQVRSDSRTVSQVSVLYPYQCLTAATFYDYALAHIASYDNVTLVLDEKIEAREEGDQETIVRASTGTYAGRYVFDGRGLPPDSPAFEEARRKAVWVPQKFLGLRLRSRKPVFDPERCTLMDFAVSQKRGLRFVYALPFTEREALIENVYLSEAEVSAEDHRAELASYLDAVYGLSPDDYLVDGEEAGYIPMTDYAFPRRLGERSYSIGMLGGETRPSTGYTFLRIQRYCKALAGSIVGGGEIPDRLPDRLPASRYQLLDRVFLRFMRERPEDCPEVYSRMFANLQPDPLVRFLTEKSTLADDWRLVMAMPKLPFVRTALRSLVLDSRRPAV